eukprot:1187418-Prorocentrum_minimum.AAC.7
MAQMRTISRCSASALHGCILLLSLMLPPAVLADNSRSFEDIVRGHKGNVNGDGKGGNTYRAIGACDKSCIVSSRRGICSPPPCDWLPYQEYARYPLVIGSHRQ